MESARPPPAQQALTPRQLARMADLSLLLDVVLKSQAASVRREFVRCGVLRQLQSSIGRNASPQFHVVRRRVALPLIHATKCRRAPWQCTSCLAVQA